MSHSIPGYLRSHKAEISADWERAVVDDLKVLAKLDETKGNLGLGLFIVAQVARAHGATYDVSSSDAETAVTIRWPRVPRSETPDRP